MTPNLPLEDPSESSSLTDRTSAYVRENLALRIVLVLTLLDYAGAAILAVLGVLAPSMAGFLVLMSVLTWFFAVALPVMNREVQAHIGTERSQYWREVVEMFARVVLCAHAVLFAAMLVFAAVQTP